MAYATSFQATDTKKYWLAVLSLMAVGGILRLFDLRLMEFRIDSAYWSLEALRLLRGNYFPLIGQQVGSISAELYNGPALTYWTGFWFALFGPQPNAVASAIAFANTLCIGLTFWLGQKMYNARIGLVAALLFTFAPWMILYGRMLWPQSLLPVLVALIMATMVWGVRRAQWIAFLVCGILLGIAIQLHLSALALLASALVISFFYARRKWHVLALGFGTILGYAPVLVYDLQNNFVNTRTLLQLPALHQVSDPLATHVAKTVWNFSNVLSGQALWVSKIGKTPFLPNALDWAQGLLFTFLFLAAAFAILWVHYRAAKKNSGVWKNYLRMPFEDALLFAMIVLPLLYLIVSRGLIQRHYFIFFFPTLFLLIGRGADLISNASRTFSWRRASVLAIPALLVIAVALNFVTDVYAYRFTVERGGESEYGTVLQDKTQAVEFILADSHQNARIDLRDAFESLPYVFLFQARVPTQSIGAKDNPNALVAGNANVAQNYRIVETYYHPLNLSAGEQVLQQTRGVVVVGATR